MRRIFFSILCVVLCGCSTPEQKAEANLLKAAAEFESKVSVQYKAIDIQDFSDGFNHARYQYPNSIPPWGLYETTQIVGFAENMVYLQNPDGGWAKNLDLQRKYSLQELEKLQRFNQRIPPVTYELKTHAQGSTIDNGNIFSQIKYLAQVYRQVPDKRYLDCLEKAVQWILNAQHPTSGGFTGSDVYAITYNDDVMSDTLRTLKNIASDDSLYSCLPKAIREKALKAYQKGIDCILKTQLSLTLEDGTKILTAWCQQHSHETLQPIWAREFEPPSICTSESRKVVELLMEIENPSEAVKDAIIAACQWFSRDDIKILGKRIEKRAIEPVVLNGRHYTEEKRMYDDASASPLWARFYALDASYDITVGARKPISGQYPKVNTPIWCDRGCIFTETFNDISLERRNGYSYTGTWPLSLFPKYEKWKSKNNL